MQILFSSIARAGGIEMSAKKPLDGSVSLVASAVEDIRGPGLLRTSIGLFLRGLGQTASGLGERLLAKPGPAPWQAANCG